MSDLTPERFSERLTMVLQIRGLTYDQLAARSNINATQIAHYIAGDRLPDAKNLVRLADGLDVPLDTLVGRDTATVRTFQAPPRIVTLCEDAAQLTSTQLDLLVGIAHLMVDQHKEGTA